MKRILLLAIIVTSLGLASLGYLQWTHSPTYSLKELANAIDSHDRDLVEKLMDIENVAGSMVDQMLKADQAKQKPDDLWEEAGQSFAHGIVELLKPAMTKMAKSKFLEYVEEGRFPKSDSLPNTPGFEISESFQKVADRKAKFKEIKSVEKDGKLALITVEVIDSDDKPLFPKVKMRDRDGYWQVIEIVNFGEIVGE